MKKHTLKITGLLIAIAASALAARADVAITPNLSTYGYAAGFFEYNKNGGGATGDNSVTSADLRAAKIGFALTADPLTAKVSLYDDGDKIYLLEANGTYDLLQGMSVTAGRFQSWLGYEPFDIPNGNFITNGNEIAGTTLANGKIIPGLIPNFHEGIHVDYATGKSTFGAALVDSIYNGTHPYSGDGALSDGYGIEAHYGYNDGALSIGATFAYQNNHGSTQIYTNNIYNGDLWGQYIIKKTTIGAEVYWSHVQAPDNAGIPGVKYNAYYGLVMLKQQLSDPLAAALRFSTGTVSRDGGSTDSLNDWKNTSYWKVSIAPTYTITQNLGVTAEVNYTKYNNGNAPLIATNGKGNNIYFGVQACFKF